MNGCWNQRRLIHSLSPVLNAYSVQGNGFDAGDPVENRIDWVFVLEFTIVIRGRSEGRKQTNKSKTKIVSDNNRYNDKN